MPTVTGCEARSGRAIIRGQTRFAILYWSTEGGGRPVLFSAPEGTPFEFILEMEELEVGMDLNCRCRPVGVSAQIVSGREVAVEANLEMYLRGCRRRQLTMLREVTSEGDLVPTRKDVLRVDQFIAQEERQTVVERTLNLPGDLPRVADILHVEAQAQVGAITITEGRLAVEGEARVGLYYRTGREDPYPLRFAGWSEPISFTLAVDVAGAHPGMEGVAELAVIDARAFLPNEEQVTVALVIGGAIRVYEPLEEEAVLEAVALEPQEGDLPSITFVIVQEDDTLWKLSRLYRTTEEHILRANPHLREMGGRLEKGCKLFIPRRRARGA
jgi:LysM repeat protein